MAVTLFVILSPQMKSNDSTPRISPAPLSEEPRFAEPIPNVTVAVGRDASLPCVVEHLGTYKY
ncbi:hypothetical protein J437_LFUL005710 [Ladona fulva]|uniref:Uncharacterized protein n=1 Tax=Ladona fulva TaxID=123851 RepID=A0A8K0K7E2_LADFU|nr:hypothetical protein J437_LFUL005710 [Ladona fulva]